MSKIEKIIFTSFIVLLSLVPLLWFRGNQILLGYDNVYPLNPGAFLLDRVFSWTSTIPFGTDQSGSQGSLIVHLIDSIPLFLGFSIQSAQKIVFCFWFFLILVSAFILIIRLEKAKLIDTPYLRYIFPILYAFNFYILEAWWIAERTKFSLVVATPLILAIVFPMLKTQLSFSRIVKNSIFCALILTIFNGGGWPGFPLYGGLILTLFIFYIFFLFYSILRNRMKDVLPMTIFYLLFVFWFLLLNAYTLLPFLFVTFKGYGLQVAGSGGFSGLIEWARYLSENTSSINLLRLQGIPEWYNNANHPYAFLYLNNSLLVFASFIYPLLIFISFLRSKEKNKFAIFFFLILFLVSLIFTAGVHKPLGFIYEFLMQHFPGFAIFRSPIFKFGYAYWLSASFLIGLTVSSIIHAITSRIKDKRVVISARIGFLLTVIILILAYHFPYFTGDIFRIDKAKFSSRVVVPSYISDFSKWWSVEGKKEKILLLPMLNKNWLFEQYNWNYLSLFPILGNFANSGTVENNDTLSFNEVEIVNKLYQAVNEQNNENIDSLTSMLGIRYFLVRKDFHYNIPDQKTNDPYVVAKKLISNSNISKIKSFGPWDVYQYKSPRPSMFAKNNGVLSLGVNPYLLGIENNPLALDTSAYLHANYMFSDSVVYPTCMSCEAERQDVQVEFPKPKILVDSPLYDFVQLSHRLQVPKNESADHKISRLLGDSLSMVSQLNEVLIRGRGEYYVNDVRSRLEKILDAIDKEYKNITANASNPYSTAIITGQYLMAEAEAVSDMRTSTDKKNDLINIEKVLYALHTTGDKYKNYYNSKDINVRKVYKFNLLSSGNYSLKIDENNLGKLLDADYEKIKVNVDDNKSNISTQLDGKFLNFGNVYMDKGDHRLTINLPPQQNIFTQPFSQRLAGSNCYSSYVENFSSDRIYALKFTVKNNFDSDFFYFIDDGEAFYPYLVYYFPIAGNQVKSHRVIVSTEKLPLNQESNKLRVSFCAPSLTESLYKENVADLSIVELSNPRIVLHKKENRVFVDPPTIDFTEINQTHYKVSVKNAEGPYYLVFTQRFSPSWYSSIGTHFIGNNYDNVWLVDKLGNYDIDLTYAPQKYFIFGAIISLFTLSISLIILAILKKK